MKRFLIFVAILGLLALGAKTRGMGFSARGVPSSLEETVLRAARRWATPGLIRTKPNPVSPSAEELRAGMEHWADHCATCHGNDGSGSPSVGKSLYPPAPDMRGPRTQGMTDGELFYVIERGVPLTGMPAWGNGTADGEQDSWRLVLFIRHLPEITTEELERMEAMNPRSPGAEKREREIQDFLSGK
jgi:mono/diheme cytochrome c family protein